MKKNKVIIVGQKASADRGVRDLSSDEILTYVRQRPNRSDMFKIHLGLYNLSGADTSKWINRRLQSWGEAPVIFDPTSVAPSAANIKSYMLNRGFYHSTVKDTVVYRKKKAEVIYSVIPNASYRIRKIEYEIADTAIKRFVTGDSVRLRSGRRLSPNMLDRESEALTARLRNNGYYAFNKNFIKFQADSTVGKMQVDLKVIIPPYKLDEGDGSGGTSNHPVYRINNLYVYTNYNSLAAVRDSSYMKGFDTLRSGDIHVLYKDRMNLKPGVIARVSLFEKGDLYCEDKVGKTYANLSGLMLFRSITIQFRETGDKLLDCLILLDPFAPQFYKVDFELSTNSSNMLGFSPGLNYGHRNLLKGGESFNVDFRGVFQYSLSNPEKSSREYNVGASLGVPRFLMPVSISYFKTQVPHTRFQIAYVYQRRPDYIRAMANFRFGYKWKSSYTNTYQFNFPDFNMIKMYDMSTDFYVKINNPYLRNMYSNHFILGATGSFIYNTQGESQMRRFRDRQLYYRINGEIAGNLLSAFNRAMPNDPYLGRLIAGMPYSQYVKADINLVANVPSSSRSSMVYRLYMGIGKAYGNSISMPYEKMFYAGGANSLRGWQLRGIGPGSVPTDPSEDFPNSVGDLRFELNAEHRFPLFWKFEGAFFADAGNVWSISPSDDRNGANFRFKEFYKEIALNTGLGLRVNMGYFVVRLDGGFKIHDPGRPVGQRLIPPHHWLKSDNFSIHIDINYPFNN